MRMIKKISSLLLSIIMILGTVSSITVSAEPDDAKYVLMNIPYDVFYRSEGVTEKSDDSGKVNFNYDVVSSATNKVGNYGKSGGAYHSGITAEIVVGEDDKSTIKAVGGENGAANKGVIWAVKVTDDSILTELDGDIITDDSEVTVATLGRGQTSSTDLKGYQCLTEAKDYSYYVLSEEPAYYMELTLENNKPMFSSTKGSAVKKAEITPTVSYGTNWGDVQLGLSSATDASDKQINAVVITAKDKSGKEITAGLGHLYNVWSYSDIAWRNSQIEGFNGVTITNVRYYCNSVGSNGAEPTYYVYDYPMNVKLLPKYEGTVTAAFDENNSILLTGLSNDMSNLKAQVYHSEGKPAVYTYLTPLVVDESDDDIDPVSVDVVDGKISITAGEVTNKAGTTQSYGVPVDGTSYTIALSSDNYAPFNVSVTYTAKKNNGIEIDNIENTDSLNFTVKLTSSNEITGVVIAAVYGANNEILAVKINYNATAESNFSFEKPENAKVIKAMWWDSLTSITPLANAAIKELQ